VQGRKGQEATKFMGGDQNVSAECGLFVALLDSSANLKRLIWVKRQMGC